MGVYVAEGITLLTEIPDDFPVRTFFVRKSNESRSEEIRNRFPEVETLIVNDDVFDSIADTVTPSGLIAVIKKVTYQSVEGDTVLVMDGVSDAGNVGAIIRTACARGIKSVIAIHDCADPFSPKAVRASMGGVFKTKILELSSNNALDLLQSYQKIVLDMGGEDIYSFRSAPQKAIIVGNEAHGVSEEIKSIADATVSIPMVENGVESLNASVAAGIAMYLIKQGE